MQEKFYIHAACVEFSLIIGFFSVHQCKFELDAELEFETQWQEAKIQHSRQNVLVFSTTPNQKKLGQYGKRK